MRFLANENFPFPGVRLLRENGYDVRSIAESDSGITDAAVIDMAIAEERIILTFDSDYGEILFRYAKENPPAVVYFREQKQSPLAAATLLLKLIKEDNISFSNAFTVIDNTNVRQRNY